MRVLRIGLDFDGVISDCGRLKSEAAKEMFGKDIPPRFFKRELVVGRGLLTDGEYSSLQEAIYHTWEAGKHMVSISGAKEGMETLLAQGHALTIITSRSGDGVAVLTRWMQEQGFPEVPVVSVGRFKDKRDAARGLDVFVDDDTEKLRPLAGSVPHLFLFSQLYNLAEETAAVAERTASWPDFAVRVAEIAGK